jgi:choline/glycine/proline betaine transport protein
MSEWKSDLNDLIQRDQEAGAARRDEAAKQLSEAERFVSEVVVPAFEELEAELEKHARNVFIVAGGGAATLTVTHAGTTELDYTLDARPANPSVETSHLDSETGESYKAVDVISAGGHHGRADITREDIIRHVLSLYEPSQG